MSVYRVNPESVLKVELLQKYVDADSEEIFYACVWLRVNSEPMLVIAGLRGIIKVINVASFVLESVLPGHGAAVNDLKSHPSHEELLFSGRVDLALLIFC